MSAAVPLRPALPLTGRQLEILALMAQGLSNLAICRELHLSPKTVESHVGGIYSNLRLGEDPESHRRVQAVLLYLRATARVHPPAPVARAA